MMRLKGSIVMLYLILVPLLLNSNVLFNLESVQCIYYIITFEVTLHLFH